MRKEPQIAGTSLKPLLFWRSGGDKAEAGYFLHDCGISLLRAGAGAFTLRPRQDKAMRSDALPHLPPPRILYCRERCPYSRLVREAMSALELDVVICPCPPWAKRHRDTLRETSGGEQVPYLLDGKAFSGAESERIIDHLFLHYGEGEAPAPGLFASRGAKLSSIVAARLPHERPLQNRQASEPPTSLLNLWGYEASPYTRRVREALEELALPYVMRNVPRGASRRELFRKVTGREQFPYLVDPNTQAGLFESDNIIDHLRRQYDPSKGSARAVDEGLEETFPASDPPSVCRC